MRIGPFFPFIHELLQAFRLLNGQVVPLSPISGDVVEFPFVSHFVANCFPVTMTDVAVIGMLAVDIVVQFLVRLLDGRHEAGALKRNDVVPIVIGIGRAHV